MELQILHMLQDIHAEWLEPVIILLSALGNAGLIWIALSVVLAIPKRTRLCAFTMMGAMALSFLLGNVIIKNLVARPRPFSVDSFPSGHTLNGFTAATVLFLYYKKAGVFALLSAAAIAFSRMYLFVHYPTDILAGMLLGIADAAAMYFIVKMIQKKREERL